MRQIAREQPLPVYLGQGGNQAVVSRFSGVGGGGGGVKAFTTLRLKKKKVSSSSILWFTCYVTSDILLSHVNSFIHYWYVCFSY